MPTNDVAVARGDVVLDEDAVLEHRDLGAVAGLAHDHDAVDGLAAGQELGLGDDRRRAPPGLAALAAALLLGLEPGGAVRAPVTSSRSSRGCRACAARGPGRRCSAGRRRSTSSRRHRLRLRAAPTAAPAPTGAALAVASSLSASSSVGSPPSASSASSPAVATASSCRCGRRPRRPRRTRRRPAPRPRPPRRRRRRGGRRRRPRRRRPRRIEVELGHRRQSALLRRAVGARPSASLVDARSARRARLGGPAAGSSAVAAVAASCGRRRRSAARPRASVPTAAVARLRVRRGLGRRSPAVGRGRLGVGCGGGGVSARRGLGGGASARGLRRGSRRGRAVGGRRRSLGARPRRGRFGRCRGGGGRGAAARPGGWPPGGGAVPRRRAGARRSVLPLVRLVGRVRAAPVGSLSSIRVLLTAPGRCRRPIGAARRAGAVAVPREADGRCRLRSTA